MKIHILKTDPNVFQQSWTGQKMYEIRLNDRNYQIDDRIVLHETQFTGEEMKNGMPLIYTGRELNRVITCITDGYGLKDDWVILGVE